MSEDNAFAMFRRQTPAQFATRLGLIALIVVELAAFLALSPN